MEGPVVENEAERLAALRALAILDTPREDRFDRITRMATRLFGVPIALISLVDADRQWFKSCQGLGISETPRSISFCAHALVSDGPLVIPDARRDPRFSDNPLVTAEPYIRFYAGQPLADAQGMKLGTLCILDHRPRTLSQADLDLLKDLAAVAEQELNAVHLGRALTVQGENAARVRAVVDNVAEGIISIDRRARIASFNPAAERMYGLTAAAMLGQPVDCLVTASCRPALASLLERARSTGTMASSGGEDLIGRRDDGTVFPLEFVVSVVEEEGGAALIAIVRDITERRQAERRGIAQHRLSVVLAETEELDAVRILSAIGDAIAWPVGALYLVDRDTDLLVARDIVFSEAIRSPTNLQEVSAFDRVTREARFAKGVGLPGRVWALSEPEWVQDVQRDGMFPRTDAAKHLGLRAAFAFPIVNGREVLGVIEFFHPDSLPPDPPLLRTIATFGNQIGQFISRTTAQAAVRESEARTRVILESALDCIVTIDHRGHILEWNPAAEGVFGHRRGDVIGRELAALLIPPETRHAHRAGLARYLATGEGPVIGRRIEVTGLHADGHEIPLELAITRIPLPGPPNFTAYLRDISVRRVMDGERAEQVRLALLSAAVGTALTRSETLADMLRHCTEAIVDHCGAAFARIWTLDETQQLLVLQASAGRYTHLDGSHARVRLGELKIGRIAQDRRPVLSNDVIRDIPGIDRDWAAREGMVAFAGYPLVVEQQPIGVLAMFAREPLTPAALHALAVVADGIALGIKRKRVEEDLTRLSLVASKTDNAVVITDAVRPDRVGE